MQPAKRVMLNTGILYVRMAITVFISLYVTRLVLAALGAEDYGIFNVVGGAIAMLTFLNVAMTGATQRFMSYSQGEGDKDKQKNIFNVSVLLHVLIGMAVIIIIEIAGIFLFNGILDIPDDRIHIAKLIFHFMLLSTFFTIISVPYDAVINAHENMLFVAIMGILEALLKLAIAIYITSTTYDKLMAYGILMMIIPLAILFSRGIYCHIKYEEVTIHLKKYFNRPLFKEMTSFASWSLLSSTASILTMQGVTIILNSFFGVIVNAAQGIATQISGQLMAFSTTMLKALNPVIVKSEGASNREQMLKAAISGNKLSFFLLAFFSIPVLIEMPVILGFWLKKVPDYAIIFCRLNLLRVSISQLTVTFGTAIGAIGKIKQVTVRDSIIYASLLPVSYVMFKFGMHPSVIYINLIIMVLGLFSTKLYYLNKLGGLSVKDYLFKVVARLITLFIITMSLSALPLLFMEPGLVRVLIVGTISSLVFVTGTYYWALDKTEKAQIEKMLVAFTRKFKAVNG